MEMMKSLPLLATCLHCLDHRIVREQPRIGPAALRSTTLPLPDQGPTARDANTIARVQVRTRSVSFLNCLCDNIVTPESSGVTTAVDRSIVACLNLCEKPA
jgi:hypothetical protein